MKKNITMPKLRWLASRKAWRMDARYKGQRKTFYSHQEAPRTARAEVRHAYLDWLDLVDQERLGTVKRVSFDEAWDAYLRMYKARYRVTSYKQTKGRGKAHLIKVFAGRYLDEISKVEWQQVIIDAHKNGARSRVTLSNIAGTIRAFCKYCATRGWLPDAKVPLFFDLPAYKKPPKKKILQPQAFARLLAASYKEDWYVPSYQFILLTGLRRGEFCALQRERDYKDGILSIKETISHDGDITPGKTKDALRSFAPLPLALKALADHEEAKQSLGISSDYLFCDPYGEQIPPRVLGHHWRKFRTANEMDVTLHELRHSFISYSRLLAKLDLDKLKQLIGHSESMDTEGTYVHEILKSETEAASERAALQSQAKQIDGAIQKMLQELNANQSANQEI